MSGSKSVPASNIDFLEVVRQNWFFVLLVALLLGGLAIVLVTQLNKKKDEETEAPVVGGPAPAPLGPVCINRNCKEYNASLVNTVYVPVPTAYAGQIVTELQEYINAPGNSSKWTAPTGQVVFKRGDFEGQLIYDISDGNLERIFRIYQDFSGDPEKTVVDFVTKPDSGEIEIIGRRFVNVDAPVPRTMVGIEDEPLYGGRAYIRVTQSSMFQNGCGSCITSPGTEVQQTKTVGKIDYCASTVNCSFQDSGFAFDKTVFQPLVEDLSGTNNPSEILTTEVDDKGDPFFDGQSDVYGTSFIGTKTPFSFMDLNLIADNLSRRLNIPAENFVFVQHDREAWAGFSKDTSLSDFNYFYYVSYVDGTPTQIPAGSTGKQFTGVNYSEPTRGTVRVIYPSSAFSDGNCPAVSNCNGVV